MARLEDITENDVRRLLNKRSLQRAGSYVRRVVNPTRSDQTLSARVNGSRPYEVEIQATPHGLVTRCSCPYDWGGACKHVGAVLLRWIHSPGDFAPAPVDAVSTHSLRVIPVEPPPTISHKEPPFWVTTTVDGLWQADREQLDTWLTELRMQDLRQIARQRNWRVRGTRKQELVAQVAEQMVDRDGIVAAYFDLDDEIRNVLHALLLLGDHPSTQPQDIERLARAWGRLERYRQIGTYMRRLCEKGLAIPGSAVNDYEPVLDFVPLAIARHLPPVLEEIVPTAANLPPGTVADEIVLSDPRPLLRAISQIVLLMEQTPVPLRPPMPRPHLERFYAGLAGWDYDPDEVARAEAKRMFDGRSNLALSVPPPARALPDDAVERLAPIAGGEPQLDFIYALLLTTHLAQPGSPVTVVPELRTAFLNQSEDARRAILTRALFVLSEWDALWETLRATPQLKLRRMWVYRYFTPDHLRADLIGFRLLALRALASLPDGRWVSMADLLRVLRAIWPRFDANAGQRHYHQAGSSTWYLARPASAQPLRPGDEGDWNLAQGNVIRTLIRGPLHWLGLADLALQGNELVGVRFRGLSDLWWDRAQDVPLTAPASAPAAASARDALRIDDLAIHVDATAVETCALSFLDQIARLEVASPQRFVYRLDGQATHATFEQGRTLADLLADWEHALGVPVPPAICEQLQLWWTAYGRVRVYRDLTVIEFGDDYALAEVRAVTSLDRVLVAEVSPRLVVIPRDAVDALVEELEKAGYTPKQTDRVG